MFWGMSGQLSAGFLPVPNKVPNQFPISGLRFQVPNKVPNRGFKVPDRVSDRVPVYRVLGLRFPTKFRYRALELRLLTGSR